MRTATVKLLGAEHLLCLSVRAKLEIDEELGSLEEAFDKLQSNDSRVSLETTFALLEIMMRAGAAYAKANGLTTAEPRTRDDMMDLVGFAELPELVASLRNAIINGANREVEAEGMPKNAEATTPPA